jgi:hypothetical protein
MLSTATIRHVGTKLAASVEASIALQLNWCALSGASLTVVVSRRPQLE